MEEQVIRHVDGKPLLLIRRGIDLGNTRNPYALFQLSPCELCGKERWVRLIRGVLKYNRCNACKLKGTKQSPELIKKRFANLRGEKSPMWKGGINHADGYLLIKVNPDDFFYSMAVKGYIREHRLVMARHLSRCLQKWEIVHHKNGNRQDNRLDNLELMTSHSHHKDHNKGYSDGFDKGFTDGRSAKIRLLETKVKELEGKIGSTTSYSYNT